jgi:uncharacterized caspase-like protein
MRKVAFLVGNDTFPADPSIPPLRFAQNDAEGLKKILDDPETCGFETKIYLDENSQKVLADLEQISGELEPDDTLLFYYAGHGKLRKDGQLCLASRDTTMANLGARSIRARDVLYYLQESHARRRVLILDCCQSGAIGREFRGNDLQTSLASLADSFGSYILTASTSIELAQEREKDGHGVFTKALIDCLREGPKERITINDLYEYAHSRLRISARQTPLFWALQQEGMSVEIGNYQAKHERERQRRHEQLEQERQLERERLERERQVERERLIATARTRLGAYVTLGELTEDAVALLKRDEARLFPRNRRYRDDLIRFSKGEASFLEVFGPGHSLRPEPAPKPPEDEGSPLLTPPDAQSPNLPLTLYEQPSIGQTVTPPEPAVVDQFVTAPEPAAAEEPVLLSEPPVFDPPFPPPEPAIVDEPVTPSAPEMLPGTDRGGEPQEAKKPVLNLASTSQQTPSPTDGLFIILATFAIVVVILASYFYTSAPASKYSDYPPASPVIKAPAPSDMAPVKAPAPLEMAPVKDPGLETIDEMLRKGEDDYFKAMNAFPVRKVPTPWEAPTAVVKPPSPVVAPAQVVKALGMELSNLTEETRKKFPAIKNDVYNYVVGVVVTNVDPISAAAAKSIRTGDVMGSINMEPVNDPADVAKRFQALKSRGDKSASLFFVTRRGDGRFVDLPLRQ